MPWEFMVCMQKKKKEVLVKNSLFLPWEKWENAYICTTLSLYLSVAWSIWQGHFPIQTSLSVNKQSVRQCCYFHLQGIWQARRSMKLSCSLRQGFSAIHREQTLTKRTLMVRSPSLVHGWTSSPNLPPAAGVVVKSVWWGEYINIVTLHIAVFQCIKLNSSQN